MYFYRFKSENINVLIVSWGKGAEYPDYQFAAVNSRIVGRELSLILNHIEKIFFPEDSNNFSIHCIGHSLGKISLFRLFFNFTSYFL